MDHALTHLEAATEEIQKLVPVLRNSNLDDFEVYIRRALLLMYGEFDQWRIRALRIVMGKLMAVCFPLIIQSARWRPIYQRLWGLLRVRVVVDHSEYMYPASLSHKCWPLLAPSKRLPC